MFSVCSQGGGEGYLPPHPGQDGGTPRYLQGITGEGVLQGTYPPAKVPTPSRSGWGERIPKVPTPPPRYLSPVQFKTGEGGTKVPTLPPIQVRMGEGYPKVPTPWPRYLPSPPPRDRTAYGVLDTLRLVCLLRSRRRTFLFP